MALFLFDSDILTLLQHQPPRVVAETTTRQPAELGIPGTVLEEQLTGWIAFCRKARSPREHEKASLKLTQAVSFIARSPIYPYTSLAAQRFELLRIMKLNVGGMDLRIAATALELGATVVTRNVHDFSRVPGLQWVNWAM